MKIANAPPAHLSCHEVLNHFLELREDNIRLQEALKSRKDRAEIFARDNYPTRKDKTSDWVRPIVADLTEEEEAQERIAERRGISEDLIWVQDEVLKYLCADNMPTSRQNEESISTLADELQDFGLSKSEVLQIINLAPTSGVELYCIIEEVDRRFPDPQVDLPKIGQLVSSTLLESAPDHLHQIAYPMIEEEYEEEDEEMMMANDQPEFVEEAAWGRDHEGGVEDEKDGEIDS